MKTLAELAEAIDAELIGDPNQPIQQVVHPVKATGPQDLALILDQEILSLLVHLKVQTVLMPQEMAQIPTLPEIPNQLRVKRPKVALAKLLEIFEKPIYIAPGIDSTAVVDPSARISPDAFIGPYAVVGPDTFIGSGSRLAAHVSVGANVQIGENCLLHPGSVVGDRVIIRNNVILQPNAVVGSDGFSYVTPEKGSVEAAKEGGEITAQNTEILRINSVGTVILEDGVEIGANSCVDRATLGETRIGKGTKIDNQVQVGHNVTLGENCLIAGQVGIAGSAKIGNRVVLGGQVGVRDHVTVGDDVVVVAKSGITTDVPAKTILMGLQGMPRKDFLKREVKMNRLLSAPEQLAELTKRLEALEAQNKPQPEPV